MEINQRLSAAEIMGSINSNSPEFIITKIKVLNVEEQVKALSWSDEPQRTELLQLIVAENLDSDNKDFILKVKQRFDNLSNIQPTSFTKFETEFYKSILILTYHDVLYKEDFIDFIEWVLWDLHLEVERKKYERENSKSERDKYEMTNEISSSGRYEIYLRALLNDLISRTQNELNNSSNNTQIENIFIIPAKLESLYEILKDFFPKQEQPILFRILTNGSNASEKLSFRGRANQLCDVFRQLYDKTFIPGYQKKDLERWLITNFMWLSNAGPQNLKAETTERSISGHDYVCRTPIIKIEDGNIVRAQQKSKKNR